MSVCVCVCVCDRENDREKRERETGEKRREEKRMILWEDRRRKGWSGRGTSKAASTGFLSLGGMFSLHTLLRPSAEDKDMTSEPQPCGIPSANANAQMLREGWRSLSTAVLVYCSSAS